MGAPQAKVLAAVEKVDAATHSAASSWWSTIAASTTADHARLGIMSRRLKRTAEGQRLAAKRSR
jgi:hypothetical protein